MPYQYEHYWIYLEILAVAVLNNIGQNLMTYSNQFANPATVGLIGYIGVFYNFLADLYLFGITFIPLQIVGVVICVTFCILAAIYKIYKQRQEEKIVEPEADNGDYERIDSASQDAVPSTVKTSLN